MIPGSDKVYWFLPPLVVAISLVYAASRHESWPRIKAHATRLGLTIMGLMVAAVVVLQVINNVLL